MAARVRMRWSSVAALCRRVVGRSGQLGDGPVPDAVAVNPGDAQVFGDLVDRPPLHIPEEEKEPVPRAQAPKAPHKLRALVDVLDEPRAERIPRSMARSTPHEHERAGPGRGAIEEAPEGEHDLPGVAQKRIARRPVASSGTDHWATPLGLLHLDGCPEGYPGPLGLLHLDGCPEGYPGAGSPCGFLTTSSRTLHSAVRNQARRDDRVVITPGHDATAAIP